MSCREVITSSMASRSGDGVFPAVVGDGASDCDGSIAGEGVRRNTVYRSFISNGAGTELRDE